MKRIDVFISSTSRDLPTHRKEAMDACLRMGMFPIMMEHLPSSDADAIKASLAMVDDAEIYLGIFAWRYGYVPAGHDISITEMEYNHAVKRGIPRYIFIMHDDHEIKAADVEKGLGADRLEVFKQRLMKEQVVSFFKSPEDLRGHVIHALVPRRVIDTGSLHSRYASDIPLPPDPYVAHPYTLLQTGHVIGRKKELAMLTEWATKSDTSVYNFVVAIGGMGKSALTWKWFNDIAPHVVHNLAGRMWWSFYESDALFENFIARALAYVSRRPKEEIENLPITEQEMQLLGFLDKETFLIVFDGLERIMVAYARMDAARMADDDLDERTANYTPDHLPVSSHISFASKHHLRKTADPRVGAFLRKMRLVKKSRILVSTRLYPAELQSVNGEPLPGSSVSFLSGLEDEDALELWQSFEVSGSPDILLPIFHRFSNHPLLVRALAGEVATYRRHPKDFDKWYQANPDFNSFELPAVQVKSHVLTFALQGLKNDLWEILHMIAAFRMPASYATLAALLVGGDKLLAHEHDLDTALVELEDRGLLGWDKHSNRYDLHPIVRGVVWEGIRSDTRKDVYHRLQKYFATIPTPYRITSIDDIAPSIELYNTLIGLEQFDAAFEFFTHRLSDVMTWRLSRAREQVELLELLFPNGVEQTPSVNDLKMQSDFFFLYARANKGLNPNRSAEMFQRHIDLAKRVSPKRDLAEAFEGLSDVQRMIGKLYASEVTALKSVVLFRELNDEIYEGRAYYRLGLVLAARGLGDKSEAVLTQALHVFEKIELSNAIAGAYAFLAQNALWAEKPEKAILLADHAWNLTEDRRFERDFIRAARLKGTGALRVGDLETANERLHHALIRSRNVNMIDEELSILVALSELALQVGNIGKSREILDDVWEFVERGHFMLVYADALNILSQIEYRDGHPNDAITAANRAYELAWCDGPPYAYHWGLETAKKHLDKLDAPYPDMPLFDPSKYEAMLEVESDLLDEILDQY